MKTTLPPKGLPVSCHINRAIAEPGGIQPPRLREPVEVIDIDNHKLGDL